MQDVESICEQMSQKMDSTLTSIVANLLPHQDLLENENKSPSSTTEEHTLHDQGKMFDFYF